MNNTEAALLGEQIAIANLLKDLPISIRITPRSGGREFVWEVLEQNGRDTVFPTALYNAALALERQLLPQTVHSVYPQIGDTAQLDTVASLLDGGVEIQYVHGAFFLTQDDPSTLEEPQIKLSMTALHQLFLWLSARQSAILELARKELHEESGK